MEDYDEIAWETALSEVRESLFRLATGFKVCGNEHLYHVLTAEARKVSRASRDAQKDVFRLQRKL